MKLTANNQFLESSYLQDSEMSRSEYIASAVNNNYIISKYYNNDMYIRSHDVMCITMNSE